MKQTEYLYENYREELPAWLAGIGRDSRIPWKSFLRSRTVFYPGAGLDPYTVNAFTRSHSAHCFINVDYNIAKEQLEAELRKPMFPGYFVVYERDTSESFFFSMFRQPYSYVADFGLDSGEDSLPDWTHDIFTYRHADREHFDTVRHYVKFLVFEREAHLDDSFGAKRFALLFIGGDAFPVFNALYANRNAHLFALLMDDYGFGAQYAYYERGELLHMIAKRRRVYPELILTERCTGDRMWDGFEPVAATDGPEEPSLGRVPRVLYKHEGQLPRRQARAESWLTLWKGILEEGGRKPPPSKT